MRRLFVVLSLLCTVLITGPRSAQAGYEWCSVDPTLSFTRVGLLSSRLVDVQVLVPLSALPLKGTAQLNVEVPSNVKGREILNTSLPLLFTLRTSFAPANPTATSSRYDVDLALDVPAGAKPFPIRLLVVNLSSGKITTIEGVAGQTLHHTLQIVE